MGRARKKWKPLLLIVAAMVIYAGGLSLYFSRMPSLFYAVRFLTNVYFDKDLDFQTCLHGMENMHLEPMKSPQEQKLTALGMSFVFDTKESVVPQNKGEFIFTYRVGKEKFVILSRYKPNDGSKENLFSLDDTEVRMRDLFREEKAKLLFEKATGKSPDSEYVCEEAFRDVSIWDFSPLDNTKNYGVLVLLSMKYVAPLKKHYYFDNGSLIGVLDQNERVESLVLFSSDDLNTRHGISFVGFSPAETEAILRTVTLEPVDN